jgi:hypothetical protein
MGALRRVLVDIRVIHRPLKVVILRLCQPLEEKSYTGRSTNPFLVVGWRSMESSLNERYGVSSGLQVSSVVEEVDEWSKNSRKISTGVSGQGETHGLRVSGIKEIITAWTTTRRAKCLEAPM